jgi:hypothetical protein
MITPEQHNQLRGHTLTVKVMDIIRHQHTAGERVTIWSIRNQLAQEYALGTNQRKQLHGRISHIIRQFEASGSITTEKEWNAKHEVFSKVITLC